MILWNTLKQGQVVGLAGMLVNKTVVMDYVTSSRLERMSACREDGMEDGMEDDAVVDCGVAHLDGEPYLLLNYGLSIHIVCDCNCYYSIHLVVDVVPL